MSAPILASTCAVLPFVMISLYAPPDRDVWIHDGAEQLPRHWRSWFPVLASIGFVNVWMLLLQLSYVLLSIVYTYPTALPSFIAPPR